MDGDEIPSGLPFGMGFQEFLLVSGSVDPIDPDFLGNKNLFFLGGGGVG